MSNTLQFAEQMRAALQMFAQTLADDDAMSIATVYPAYKIGKAYAADEIFI